jgi:hypothetical protein
MVVETSILAAIISAIGQNTSALIRTIFRRNPKDDSRIDEFGILHVFENMDAAKSTMWEDMQNTTNLYVFAATASFFAPSANAGNHWENLRDWYANNEYGKIQFLLSDPKSLFEQKRSHELGERAVTAEMKDIPLRISGHRERNHNVEYKLHAGVARHRLYIFDNVMYLGFRVSKKNGTELPLYRITKGNCLYDSYVAYFRYIWNSDFLVTEHNGAPLKLSDEFRNEFLVQEQFEDAK